MRALDVPERFTTPIDSPAYPMTPPRFTDREYLNITYRSDLDVLRRLVPEPLTVVDPLVRFEMMRMPDSTGLGDYSECGLLIKVELDGEEGEFNLAMYVDSLPAIASGRELSAYPKKLANPRLYLESDTLVGTLDYGSLRVATATMGYKHQDLTDEQARAEICKPTYLLKIMPGYDGKPRICELACTTISEVVIKGAWTSPARLQLFTHVMAPMADLPVLEVVSSSHILTDLTLGHANLVRDYLNS